MLRTVKVTRNVRNKLKKEVWGTSSVLPIFRILEVQNFTPNKFISGREGGGVNLAENCQKLYTTKKTDMYLILIYFLGIGISVFNTVVGANLRQT